MVDVMLDNDGYSEQSVGAPRAVASESETKSAAACPLCGAIPWATAVEKTAGADIDACPAAPDAMVVNVVDEGVEPKTKLVGVPPGMSGSICIPVVVEDVPNAHL